MEKHRYIVSTLDVIAETLESRGSSLAGLADAVAETVLEDLYEELDRAGFDDFVTRDQDVAQEIRDQDPSLIPDPSYTG